MKTVLPALGALALLVVIIGRTDRVVIACDCVGNYPAWVCITFWWALC